MKTREELQKAMDDISVKHEDFMTKEKKEHDDFERDHGYSGDFSDLTDYHEKWFQDNLEGEQLKEFDRYLEARSKFGWVISEAINWICDKVAPKTTLDMLKEDELI